MNRARRIAKVVLLAGLLLVPALPSPIVRAKTVTKTSGDITVAPAALTAQIGSKQLQTTFSVGVKNNYTVPVSLNAELSGLDVRNNRLYPTKTAETALTTTTTILPTQFTLEPGKTQTVEVTLNDSAALNPGGHFAALLITQAEAAPGASASSNLSLQAAISASIYVIKEDGALRNVVAKAITTNRSLFSLPSLADVKFYNNGNVNVVPRGTLTITKSGQDTPLARAIINPTSLPLFAKQTTKLQSTFKAVASPYKPGKYTLTAQYGYIGDGTDHLLVTSFWYVPKMYVLVALFIVVITVYFSKHKRRLVALKYAKKLARNMRGKYTK